MTRPIFISNFCPLCGEKVQQSAIINIAQPAKGWILPHPPDGAWCHMISGRDGIERIVYMKKVSEPK